VATGAVGDVVAGAAVLSEGRGAESLRAPDPSPLRWSLSCASRSWSLPLGVVRSFVFGADDEESLTC
jgi:hypothetical protein